MTVSPIGQGKVFLINIGIGIFCVILFDLLYVVRKKHVKSKVVTNIFDALYFTLLLVVILYTNIKFNFGAVRYYQFIGLITGGVAGMLLSHLNRKIIGKIYDVLLKISKVLAKLIYKPFMFVLRLILSPLFFFEAKAIRAGEKVSKRFKKLKIKKKKNTKTVKKRIKMI